MHFSEEKLVALENPVQGVERGREPHDQDAPRAQRCRLYSLRRGAGDWREADRLFHFFVGVYQRTEVYMCVCVCARARVRVCACVCSPTVLQSEGALVGRGWPGALRVERRHVHRVASEPLQGTQHHLRSAWGQTETVIENAAILHAPL